MPTVGEIIKAEREKKGLLIKDIENGTSIRSLYLQAIEEDNYSVIPGEVYLKGFIRNYANFLGLNGQEMINMYRENQIQVVPVETPVEPLPQVHPQKKSIDLDDIRKNIPFSKKWVSAVVLVILLAGGIYYGQSGSQTNPEKTKSVPEANVVQPSKNTQQAAIQQKPVTVIAKYTDLCWTSVVVDGKQTFEGTPKAGESLTWDAQQTIQIRLGNAGVVDLTYNGNSIGKIGATGEVAVKTFSKQ